MQISLTFFLLFLGPSFANEFEIQNAFSQKGIVENVEYVDNAAEDFVQTKQVAVVKLRSGDLKNNLIVVENMLTGNPYYDISLKKGMRVILHVEENDGDYIYSIADIERSHILLILSAFFCYP